MYTLAVGTLGCIADVKCCLVNKVLSVDYRSLHALQCWLGNKVLSVDYRSLHGLHCCGWVGYQDPVHVSRVFVCVYNHGLWY